MEKMNDMFPGPPKDKRFVFYQCTPNWNGSVTCQTLKPNEPYKIKPCSKLLFVNKNIPNALHKYALHAQMTPSSVIVRGGEGENN
jgi:hypothetical protein